MSAPLLITHRRMQGSADGTHQHIGWVKLYDGTIYTRDEVVALLRRGYVFESFSPQGHRARVIAVACRRCGYTYIRTDRDMWRDDNLDMLPTF